MAPDRERSAAERASEGRIHHSGSVFEQPTASRLGVLGWLRVDWATAHELSGRIDLCV